MPWPKRSPTAAGASCTPCFRTKARAAGSCILATWSFSRLVPPSGSVSSCMAGNRTGKTETGAYEMACHLTGQYPPWWQGKRFAKRINAWACGTTNGTTRDIVQEKLLGPEGAHGTGMIPADSIDHVTNKQGLPNAVDSIYVRHALGGISRVSFKSYESGRKSFEGTAQHVIWLDEESPLDIYIECLYRTATTGGVLYTTFTPLAGMSDVVKSFLEPENEEAAAVKHQTRCKLGTGPAPGRRRQDRKSTRLNSSHLGISYAVFCL